MDIVSKYASQNLHYYSGAELNNVEKANAIIHSKAHTETNMIYRAFLPSKFSLSILDFFF